MNLKEHLEQRHCDIKLHNPILDQEEEVVTFLLYNLSQQIVGFQQYRPNGTKNKKNDPREGRYFTFHRKQTIAVFGIESLHLTPDIVFVTEGIFDAARLTNRGVSAIATLSNNPNQDCRNFLRSLGRKIVVVCDNDIAGKQLANCGDVAIFTEEKDLGECSEQYISEIIEKFVK
jgi:DNA primase